MMNSVCQERLNSWILLNLSQTCFNFRTHLLAGMQTASGPRLNEKAKVFSCKHSQVPLCTLGGSGFGYSKCKQKEKSHVAPWCKPYMFLASKATTSNTAITLRVALHRSAPARLPLPCIFKQLWARSYYWASRWKPSTDIQGMGTRKGRGKLKGVTCLQHLTLPFL